MIERKESEILDKSLFTQHHYHSKIFLDFDIPTHFSYSVERQMFRYYDSLVSFLSTNPNITIYLTNNKSFDNFQYFGDDILANIDSLIYFCDYIGYSKRNQNRIKAFLGQHVSLHNIQISEEDKQKYIEANLTEQHLVSSLKNVAPELQEKLLNTILELTSKENEHTKVPNENLINIFTKFLSEGKIQNSILDNLPQIQLSALKELKIFVEQNLDKEETFFQNWLDEDNGKYRRKRCLIFGLEYVDPKREGEIMGRKRFDILATQNREQHILIELKSPTAELFDIENRENSNGGLRTTYKLSRELSRAIPQVLSYKRWYGQLNSEKLQELGLSEKKELSECIIVIGTRKEDKVWEENYQSLCDHIKIKILTYTDLIEKMENTIKNIENNL